MIAEYASTRLGRILLVIFGVLLAASAAWTLSRLHLAGELRQEITTLTATMSSMEKRLGVFEVARLEKGPPDEAYLQGETPAIAAAALQKMVAAAIRQAGGQLIESGRDESAAATGEEEAIYLHVAFAGTNTAMQRTLYDIESGRPWVVIRSLVVAPSADNANDPELRVQMLVAAQWRKPR